MPYYFVCPYCGASLDRGEKCDCQKERTAMADDTDQSGKENAQLNYNTKEVNVNETVTA